MDTLSWRDRSKIRTAIADKIVDKICTDLINNQPLSGNLRQSLGNEMLNVLTEPDNKAKISQTVLQAVNTSVGLALQGPLLLYALMDNDQSYQYTQNMVTFIFGQVYKENDTINAFSGRLVERLQDPPYQSWFKNLNTATGGKKINTSRRKSIRKKYNRKSNRKLSRKRKIYGGANAAAVSAATDLVQDAASKVDTDEIKDLIDNNNKEEITENEAESEQQPDDETGAGQSEEKNDESGVEEQEEEGEFEEKNDEPSVGDQEKEGESEEQGEESSSDSNTNSSSRSSSMFRKNNRREMTGYEIDENADELVQKYNDALFKLISKDLETVKSQILQRMLNACYLHATNNSSVILTSITGTIGNIIQENMNNSLIKYDYVSFIIIVQALRQSYKDIITALTTTFLNQKQKASDEGKKEEIKFNPNDSNFVVDFMSNFKNIVVKQINNE
tara:strand:- start:2402 stop:3739 length:1338 start_codon:yes stop_codon:yes gene_type:complete